MKEYPQSYVQSMLVPARWPDEVQERIKDWLRKRCLDDARAADYEVIGEPRWFRESRPDASNCVYVEWSVEIRPSKLTE